MSTDISSLVNLFTVGHTFATTYFAEHPRVREATEEFVQRLRVYLSDNDEDGLFIGVVNGRLVVKGSMLLGPTLISRRFIDSVKRLHSGGLYFNRELYPGELIELFCMTGGPQAAAPNLALAKKEVRTRGIQNIQISAPYGEPGWLGNDAPQEALEEDFDDSAESMIGFYQSLFESVEKSHSDAERGADVQPNEARSTVESLMGAMRDSPEELLHLSRYPDYDSYTIGHSVRVALFSLLVARDLQLDDRTQVEIGAAAILHDVGKSKIPREILFKTGRLDDEERRVMNQHAWFGGQILIESEDASAAAIGAAFGHHIRFDRRGYPTIPRWAATGPITDLIQVCDVFEALTAVRPYKPSMAPTKAFEIMLEDRGSFNQGYLRQLIRSVGHFPPGSRVNLSTGAQAVVCRPGQRLDRPLVRITHETDGIALSRRSQPLMDLSHPEFLDVEVTGLTLAGQEALAVS